MAGRGRRLDNSGEFKKLGSLIPLDDSSVDLPTLTKKIHEINVARVDHALLNSIEITFKKLCSSKEVLKDVLSNLHCEALCDIDFGEKLLIALQSVLNLEIDGTCVRGELLSCIQADFEERHTMSKLNHKKFLNAAMLLGSAYKRVKVCGVPIFILGTALLEYFDLLAKSKEPDDFKVLVKQLLINGQQLSKTKELAQNYELLKCSLRNILINQNLSNPSRCWVLLAIDFLSNKLRPLKGLVRDYYVTVLSDDYLKLEAIIEIHKEDSGNSASPNKSDVFSPPKVKNLDHKSKKTSGLLNDNIGNDNVTDRFADLNVSKSESDDLKGKKGIPIQQFNKIIKKENQKWQGDVKLIRTKRGNPSFEHDDRFNKEEDYYGVQLPRRPKPENQKKTNNDKSGNDEFKNDLQSDSGSSITNESSRWESKPEQALVE